MNLRVTSVVSLFLVLISLAFSQNMPFPQAKDFAGCIKPTTVTQLSMNKTVSDHYDDYIANFMHAAGSTAGGYYIEAGGTGSSYNTITVSEAHGYGMIITALMAGYDSNAKKYFDGMFYFFKDHLSSIGTGLMSWEVFGDASSEQSTAQDAATDGDMDIAYALVLAHYQWGSTGAINYLQEAKNLISKIKSSEVNADDFYPLLGDWVDNTSNKYNGSRPSDWMTDHWRIFKSVSGDNTWTTLASNAYSFYNDVVSADAPNTGLISDFVTIDLNTGVASAVVGKYLESSKDENYWYNACRVPWRFALDYAHYGTAEAKAVCDKIATWLEGETGGDATSIAAGYTLDGTGINTNYTSDAFIAPFTAASIVGSSHQSFLNNEWTYIKDNYDGDVYERALRLLSMLTVSGNWWKPGDGSSQVDTTTTDTSNYVILDDFENAYKDDPEQSYLGAAYGTAKYASQDSAYVGGGWWYVSTDELGSKVVSGSVTIDSSNPGDMIKNGVLDVQLNTSMSKEIYPYAEVVCPILGDGNNYYDFSNMTKFSFKAKGSGKVRISFITKDISTLPNADDQWGYYGTTVALTSSWNIYEIDAGLLDPQKDSYAAGKGWSWDHGKTAVKEVNISVEDSAADISVTLDDIRFMGMSYSDFFGETYYKPGEAVAIGDVSSVSLAVRKIYAVIMNNGVKFSFPATGSRGLLSVYSVRGRMIAQKSFRSGAVSCFFENKLTNGAYVAVLRTAKGVDRIGFVVNR